MTDCRSVTDMQKCDWLPRLVRSAPFLNIPLFLLVSFDCSISVGHCCSCAFNELGQRGSSSDNKADCYTKLTVSSPAVAVTLASIVPLILTKE